MSQRSAIGNRIETACSARNVRAGELAKMIGLSANSLSSIMTGKTKDPASSIILRIADKLGVSTDFLLVNTPGLERRSFPQA